MSSKSSRPSSSAVIGYGYGYGYGYGCGRVEVKDINKGATEESRFDFLESENRLSDIAD